MKPVNGLPECVVVSGLVVSIALAWVVAPCFGNPPPPPRGWEQSVVEQGLNGAAAVDTGDMDGDGFTDLVVGAGRPTNKVLWYENPESQGVVPLEPELWRRHLVDGEAFGVRGLDVEDRIAEIEPGTPEIAAALEKGLVLYRLPVVPVPMPVEKGVSPWHKEEIGRLEEPVDVVLADIDKDGALDAASATRRAVVWFERPEAGISSEWEKHTVFKEAGGVNDISVRDMDGDGDRDIVCAETAGDTIAWYENPSPSIPRPHSEGAVPSPERLWERHIVDGPSPEGVSFFPAPVKVWVGEISGDDSPDIAAISKKTGNIALYTREVHSINDRWLKRTVDTSLEEGFAITGTDINRDGDMDMVVSGRYRTLGSYGAIFWYDNSTWEELCVRLPVPDVPDLEAADLNGDRLPDIAATAPQGGYIGWFRHPSFIRGDVNADQIVDEKDSDALFHYFAGGGPVSSAGLCYDAFDVNDDGHTTMEDVVYMAGVEDPPAPYPGPGCDPTQDNIRCKRLLPADRQEPEPYRLCLKKKLSVIPEEVRAVLCLRYPGGPQAEIPRLSQVHAALSYKGLEFKHADSAKFLPENWVVTSYDFSNLNKVGLTLYNVLNTTEWNPGELRVIPGTEFVELVEIVFTVKASSAKRPAIEFERFAGAKNLYYYTGVGTGGGAFMQCEWSNSCSERLIPVYAGDANGTESLDLSDAVYLLSYLVSGGPRPPCAQAADTNHDDTLDISDVVTLLGYLFAGGSIKAPDGSVITGGSHPGCTPYPAEYVTGIEVPEQLPGCADPCTP